MCILILASGCGHSMKHHGCNANNMSSDSNEANKMKDCGCSGGPCKMEQNDKAAESKEKSTEQKSGCKDCQGK